MVMGLLLVAVGCAPHRIEYYQLTTVVKPVMPAEAGPVVVVGRIETSQALLDARLRYRDGLNELGAYEYHRWTDPPGVLVRDSLISTLRATGKYRSVQEIGSSTDSDYSVRGKLLEFWEIDRQAGITTRVSLDIQLRESRSGSLLWTQVLSHDEPVQGKKVSDVVQSLDRNLQVVLGDAVSVIGSHMTTHPPSTASLKEDRSSGR